MNETTVRIEGMSCGHCVDRVERSLRALEGVAEVRVSLEGGTATVQHDPARVSAEALVQAVAGAGYDARV